MTDQARIWGVLRGIILTLGLGDIAGFSGAHKRGALLSSTYAARFNNAERIKETKAELCALTERGASVRVIRQKQQV